MLQIWNTYVIILPGELVQPVLPDNFEELNMEEKIKAHQEFRQVWPTHAFAKLIRKLHPRLYAILRLLLVDLLQKTLYFSSYCWCEGLPILEQYLMLLSAAYGDYIPVHDDYLVCPVLFSKDNMKQHKEEFQDIEMEESLNVQVGELMDNHGLHVSRDGSINLEDFESMVKKVGELLEFFLKDMDKEEEMMIRHHWPMREGKFIHTMESCK